jgi:predicted aminopeptidase
MRRRILAAVVLLGFLALAAGCGSLGYYAQAVRGGLAIACRKRPIAHLLADPAVEPGLKARLRSVQELRDFAVRELALPDDASYRSYADLGRPYATWTVVAAPELSIEPLSWCFPVAGCVSYRGYFSRAGAERFAARLAAQGHDVDVGGVAAFSTLGWFADPVLNTFVELPEADLAGLLFHELAHQVAYVRDDTTFNESFATAVELAGVGRWLAARGRAGEIEAFRLAQAREDEVARLVLAFRARLAEAYAAPQGAGWKRARKAEILAELRRAYRARAETWGGSRHEGWFDAGLNNARLASFGAYHELVPDFEALLARQEGDLSRFYAEVRRLARLPAAQRQVVLPAAQETAWIKGLAGR